MNKTIKVVSHDKNGSPVFADSIVKSSAVNEYFIPTKENDVYGDWFMGDFYPLEGKLIEVVKDHATMSDLKEMMRNSTDNTAIFNVKGDFNGAK
ncbi:hypothetical protein [Lactobacillus sp. LL6]|uniref:hypothetical protein n=1 Tax=Lactobacillus sp. LL6 TaxID=2596827 RepID=UPI001F5BA60E|nr:hypothetical protein [Lactobacillus sp. LL6]